MEGDDQQLGGGHQVLEGGYSTGGGSSSTDIQCHEIKYLERATSTCGIKYWVRGTCTLGDGIKYWVRGSSTWGMGEIQNSNIYQVCPQGRETSAWGRVNKLGGEDYLQQE